MKEMKENGGRIGLFKSKFLFFKKQERKKIAFFLSCKDFLSTQLSNGIQYERELRDKSKTLAKGQSYSILSKYVGITGIRTRLSLFVCLSSKSQVNDALILPLYALNFFGIFSTLNLQGDQSRPKEAQKCTIGRKIVVLSCIEPLLDSTSAFHCSIE